MADDEAVPRYTVRELESEMFACVVGGNNPYQIAETAESQVIGSIRVSRNAEGGWDWSEARRDGALVALSSASGRLSKDASRGMGERTAAAHAWLKATRYKVAFMIPRSNIAIDRYVSEVPVKDSLCPSGDSDHDNRMVERLVEGPKLANPGADFTVYLSAPITPWNG